jgi:quercetin dioxygenase-like cupin family protein
VHYVRLYADESGESRFEDVELPTSHLKSPVSSTVFEATDPLPLKNAAFRRVISEVADGEPHCAPRPQFIVHLSGNVEVETSTGEKRLFAPGSVLLAEDTTGRGHVTRNLGPGMRTYLQIPLES